MYKWLLFGHLIGVAFLVAGFAIYVANLDRLPLAKTVADIRTHLAVAAVGEQVLILGGALLIPSALIMARQYWSLFRGWIATSIALVLAQGAAGAAISFQVRKLHVLLADQQRASGSLIPPEIAALARWGACDPPGLPRSRRDTSPEPRRAWPRISASCRGRRAPVPRPRAGFGSPCEPYQQRLI
jgi:hypothetical protein